MKESTGGLLLMGLASVIILIFIIFVAFFINYGKTFRNKNKIINQIEQMEGLSKDDISKFIKNNTSYKNKDDFDICYNSIEKGSERVGITFKITLYIRFDRTILSDNLKFNIPVSGETKTINSGVIYDNYANGGDLTSLRIESCKNGG